jgi:hypothetical protein
MSWFLVFVLCSALDGDCRFLEAPMQDAPSCERARHAMAPATEPDGAPSVRLMACARRFG